MIKLDTQLLASSDFNSITISMENTRVNTNDNNPSEIKRILSEQMDHLKIDNKLVRDLEYYLKTYINRSEEHISFFGSNLTGVNKITFTTEDRNQLCVDLLNIDEFDIKRQVKNLPHIGDTWVRGTDGCNLGLLYLCYLTHNSSLSPNEKTKVIVNALIILQIKFLSSLLHGYFKYPVSESLAIAVYEALNRKFYIKKYGTWFNILEARAMDIYNPKGIHFKVIENFMTDKEVQYMITDIQTRIKSMILNIYEVTVRLKDKGVGVSGQSMLVSQYGKIEVRDIEKNFDTYLNYITKTMQDQRSFIKEELVEIVSDSISTMPSKLLNDMLVLMHQKAVQGDRALEDATREVVIYLFDYFKQNKRNAEDLSNLGSLILNLKSMLVAAKTSNSSVLKIRDYFDKFVKKNIKSKNPATIAGVRTGIFLYLVLRTVTKNHYG